MGKPLFMENRLGAFVVVVPKRRVTLFRRKPKTFWRARGRSAPQLLQCWINQRQIRFGIKSLLHRYRIDGNHYFQRRRYIRIEHVTPTR